MTAKKTKQDEEIEYITHSPPPEGDGVAEAPQSEPKEGDKEVQTKQPGSDSARSVKDKLKKREAEIKHLNRELAELKDQYLRKLAEIENLRKRFEREKSEYLQFSASDILAELLEIFDNFERALQSSSQEGDGKTIRDGVQLILRMFQSFLTRRGVTPIEINDKKFDPNLHHAMEMEESEAVEEPQIMAELQKGYLLHNRLLRPSLVRVAVPKKDQ